MTSNHGLPPPQAILDAFGLSGTIAPLAGGQGECFLLTTPESEKIVLKPTTDPNGSDFLCSMQSRLRLLRPTDYRIADAIPLQSGGVVTDSIFSDKSEEQDPIALQYTAQDPDETGPSTYWTATRFLSGHGCPAVRAAELLTASRALHADLFTLYSTPPPTIAARTDRWAWGDRYAWSEIPISEIPNIDTSLLAKLQPYLIRLESLLTTPVSQLAQDQDPNVARSQLIHGDLSGNLLFDDEAENNSVPPAIIDFSPYWRPVAYAEAVVAADLLLWRKGTLDVLRELGLLEGHGRLQILVRAMVFRIVVFVIDRDEGFVKRNLGLMDVEGCVGLLEGLVRRG